MRFAGFLLLFGFAATSQYVVAHDMPPAQAKPVLEVVTNLEKLGYGPIVDVSFDDGYWEVEAYKQGTSYELQIDPMSGKTMSEHRDEDHAQPPADAKPLSEILKSLAAAGFAAAIDVSFEHQEWEVDVYRDGAMRELHVDPKTAKVTSDRVDD